MCSMNVKVKSITSSKIEPSHLIDLAKNHILFIRIPHFLPQEVCQYASKKILSAYTIEACSTRTGLTHSELLAINEQAQTTWTNTPINEVGMSYFETTFDSELDWKKIPSTEKKETYYRNANKSIALTRSLFSPYLSPIDKLRLELADQWNDGLTRLSLGDGKMFCGLLRVLSGEVLAHDDKLERDHGPLPEALHYTAQFATNTYLKTPKTGGELLLWDLSLESEMYERMRGNDYGIQHKDLDKPDAILTPQEGELIIFNSRKLHGISKSNQGERISISSFMAYCGEDRPLYLWS